MDSLELDANIAAGYETSVYDLKMHMGETFIPNFIKEFGVEELKNKIASVSKKSIEEHGRTPIISFCSEKGGSGKTTSCLCVMQLIANLGFRVLLLDVDPTRGSSAVVQARRVLINAEIENADQQGVDVQNVLDFKRASEPVIDCLEVSPSVFNATLVQGIAEKQEFDLIVIDTAGLKIDASANFDIRQLGVSGKPHITTAYTSNLVIVPTGTSNLDLNKMIAYAQPLMVFLGSLKYMGKSIVSTQYRILANRVEKSGSGLKELEDAKDEVQFRWFDNSVRRSEKIAANTSTKQITTLYTTKVAKQLSEAFIEIVGQIYDDIELSLES